MMLNQSHSKLPSHGNGLRCSSCLHNSLSFIDTCPQLRACLGSLLCKKEKNPLCSYTLEMIYLEISYVSRLTLPVWIIYQLYIQSNRWGINVCVFCLCITPDITHILVHFYLFIFKHLVLLSGSQDGRCVNVIHCLRGQSVASQ